MKFDLIINQLDEHNEVGILLSKKFNTKKIVMLQKKNESKPINDLSLDEIELINEYIDCDSYNDVKNAISKYKNKNIIICLNGGDRLISIMMLKVAEELNIPCVYVDLLKKRRYVFGEDYRVIEQPLDDISICDLITLSGAKIILESTDFTNKEDIKEFTKSILENIDIWHKYKQKLYNNNIFNHDYRDTYKVDINKTLIKNDEMKLVKGILCNLKSKNEIDFIEDRDNINVRFKNDYLKSFIFKSGTWLEVLTTLIMKEIDGIDEVKSGVVFNWSEDLKRVRNELDVVAIMDSILICISCKDSDKYDEDALNELQVYSDRLGGKDAIKILVATKEPVKRSVIDRAREMDINLIILDKNINSFKKTLISVIKKKTD